MQQMVWYSDNSIWCISEVVLHCTQSVKRQMTIRRHWTATQASLVSYFQQKWKWVTARILWISAAGMQSRSINMWMAGKTCVIASYIRQVNGVKLADIVFTFVCVCTLSPIGMNMTYCLLRNVFDSCVKSWEYFHMDNMLLETSFHWLSDQSDDTVRFKIEVYQLLIPYHPPYVLRSSSSSILLLVCWTELIFSSCCFRTAASTISFQLHQHIFSKQLSGKLQHLWFIYVITDYW